MRHRLDPRALPARLLIVEGWQLIVEGAAWWQVEMLLAEADSLAGKHTLAVERLEALRVNRTLPKDQFPQVRRALFGARRRSKGLPVEWDGRADG